MTEINDNGAGMSSSIKSKSLLFFILSIVALFIGLWFIVNMLLMLSRGGIVIGASFDIGTGLVFVVIGLALLFKAIRLHKKHQ
jgi:hypothetical protein